MQLQPKPADFPRIRSAVKYYQAAAIVTGSMLLLLLVEMLLKYTPLHLELFAGGTTGGIYFAPVVASETCQWYSLFNPFQQGCELISTGTGTNLSLLILVVHGWFYVVYLIACFLLWSPMRWPFRRFLLFALGGVVPLLSFAMEVRVTRQVKHYLELRQAEASLEADAAASAA